MASSQKLTEYERRRLENIKRNEELLASLKIHSRLTDLSSSSKRQRPQTKSFKLGLEKKPKSEAPVVVRWSLRSRGKATTDDFDETLTESKIPKFQHTPKESARQMGPLSTKDAYSGSSSDQKLIETILGFSKNSQIEGVDGENDEFEGRGVENGVSGLIDLEGMKLEPDNIARVVTGRIMAVRFFPTRDRRMVVVGNKFGNVGFWNVDCKNEEGDGDGIYVYHPHSGPVSGISIKPISKSKIITCCYDGFIRLMDVEREIFDLAYSTNNVISSISHRPNDANSLYFSEGAGLLGIWDERSGKSLSSWSLHDQRINTIDFNSENTNLMVTSSTDGTACIWDLRNINAKMPKTLKVVSHKRAVHSAYFSPSGSLLATTSIDDNIGLSSGANYDDISMISHNNQTGRWISSFRAVWGWDDEYIFVGNMRRGVDVISAAANKDVATLWSPHMSAIPCRFSAHPFNVGMLAAATSGGQVYIWNS